MRRFRPTMEPLEARTLLDATAVILDNGGPNYSESGAWNGWSQGYGGSFRYSAPGFGGSAATWQDNSLSPGDYDVQVTWVEEGNRASNAPYRVFDGDTLLDTIRIDQRLRPVGALEGGSVFQELGSYSFAGAPRVVLGNDADGFVIADAVRLAALPPPVVDLEWLSGGLVGPTDLTAGASFSLVRSYAIRGEDVSVDFRISYYLSSDSVLGNADDYLLGSESLTAAADKSVGDHSGSSPAFQMPGGGTFQFFARIDSGSALKEMNEANNSIQSGSGVAAASTGPTLIDNSGFGYSESSSGWTSWSGGLGGSFRFAAAGAGDATASWQAAGLPAGDYEVQATWTNEANRATNSPYSVFDGSGLLATIRVDQQQAPRGASTDGAAFESLGTFRVTGGTLRVVLGNDANGFVIADAVRFVPIVRQLEGTSTDIEAVAGSPFQGIVATFVDSSPGARADDYRAVVTWGDGAASVGIVSAMPEGGFRVEGSHTFATAEMYAVTVEIVNAAGARVTVVSPAIVSNLGSMVLGSQTASLCFWASRAGQKLIREFNAGSQDTKLSGWLATSFPHLYGVSAGASDLTGKTNAEVGRFLRRVAHSRGRFLEAEVFATALNVYASTNVLGGAGARSHGFLVNEAGLGANSRNVRRHGESFDVPDRTMLNVYQLLQSADRHSENGVLYAGARRLRRGAHEVFNGINDT